MKKRDVGAVEQDVRRDVRRCDALPEKRHVHDAEGGDDSPVWQFHLFCRRATISGTRAAGRHVDLAVGVGATAENSAVGEPSQVVALLGGGGVRVFQSDRGGDHGDWVGTGIRLVVALSGFEALDVVDVPDAILRPSGMDAHSRRHVRRRTGVDGMQ